MNPPQTIREYLTENEGAFETRNELIDACCAAIGAKRKSVITGLSRIDRKAKGITTPLKSKGVNVPKGSEDDRTLAFRKQFDKSYIVPQKVRQVIETWLPEVKWASDADMQKRCQISGAADWKTYARENTEFEKYILYAGKKAIWAFSEEYRDELQAQVYSR